MLKNMAIHELALLATYYGVTVDNIESVEPDAEYSRCLTLTGPSGKEFTDFAKIGFTVKTKDGKTVTVERWFTSGKQAASIRTACTHVNNMIIGVTKVRAPPQPHS